MNTDHPIATPEVPELTSDDSTLGLLVVGLAGLALACLAALAFVAAFPFPTVGPPASGVVGLVTVHGYAKSREPLYYVAIVALVTAIPAACVAAWLFWARHTARRRRLDAPTALGISSLAFLPAFPGLGLGLVGGPQVVRTLAVTVATIVAAEVVVWAWPRRDSRTWVGTAILGRRLLGAEVRLPVSTVALLGCVFGWFLPMAVPSRMAPGIASAWWLWPLVFLGWWWALARLAAGRSGQIFDRAAPGAALALLPALLMLAAPFLIDFPRVRAGVLVATLVSVGALCARLLRPGEPVTTETAARATLRACRIGALALLAAAWAWEPERPGVMVLPGDGDHLIAFLNDGLNGKLVYRDFWYPYGPILYLIDLVSARLFGLDRYDVATWLVTVPLGTVLLSLTARMVFLTWPFRLLGPLFMFLAWPPRPVECRAYVGYFAVVLAVAAASSGRTWALRVAGAGAAVSFLFSHESAIAALVGMQSGLLWACRQRVLADTLRTYARRLWPFLTGLAAVLVPAALLAAAVGALVPYLRAVFGFVGITDECCGLPMPALWEGLSPAAGVPSSLKRVAHLLLTSDVFGYYYLPVLLYIVVALYVVARALRGGRRVPQDAVLLGLVGFALLYYRFVLGRSDMGRARFMTVTTLALGCALLERAALRGARLLRGHDRHARLPPEGLLELVLLAGGFAFLALKLGFLELPTLARPAVHKLAHYHELRHQPRVPYGWEPVLSSGGGRFYFMTAVAPMVQATVDYLRAHTQAGEGVFAFPYAFRYNVLLGRPNPLTFGSCLWGAAARPADQQRLVQELARKKPRYIVYDESEWPDMDGVPTGDRFAEVADFVFTHYSLEQKIGATAVLHVRDSGPIMPPSVVEVARDEDRAFLHRGWFYPEGFGPVMGRWTTTTATARLTRRAEHRVLFVVCQGYVPPGQPPRSLSASIDGHDVGRVDVAILSGWTTLRFPLPPAVFPEETVLVQLDVDRPFDPEPGRLSRRLGVMVSRLGLE